VPANIDPRLEPMAGFLSPATRERIRSASDIVDVIGGYVPLKRAGANFTALCPFHKEKSPSFNVNPQKQIFHCFGCHKGGDVFTFVKEYENIGFMDAVRRLAERAKIPLEFEDNPAAQESRHLKDQLLEIHDRIAQRWQNTLANEAAGQLARDYLKKRGVSEEAVKLFRIGAAPDAWDDTVNWAKSKDFSMEQMEKAGLVIHNQEKNSYYDRFRGRLMFPICDEQGRPVGFSGRVLSGDEKTAKYVNSPETLIFTKSKIFYGLDKSKRAILDAGFAIICEGQLDLIACFMAGVQNIVAPQGTAFTEQHARIIKRYANEVVLCFDSDNAGQNAIVRSLDHLLASGLAVRVAVVPAPHDPDSFIKANGGEAYRQLIQQAEGFFDYYLKRLCETNDFKTDKGRMTVVRSMLQALRKTGNQVIVDKHAHDLTFKLGLSFSSIVAEYKKILNEGPVAKTDDLTVAASEAAPADEPRPTALEFHLLKLLLLHEELIVPAAAHLDLEWVQNTLARQILKKRFEAQADGSWQNLTGFLDGCDSAVQRSLVTEAVAGERSMPNPELQLTDVILKLRNQYLDRKIASLMARISQSGYGEELLREQQQLKALKRTPLAPLQKGS
jgi:DNA primase